MKDSCHDKLSVHHGTQVVKIAVRFKGLQMFSLLNAYLA